MSKRKRGPTPRREWGEWEERGISFAIKAIADRDGARVRFFCNARYRVLVYELPDGLTHLSIRNQQNTPLRDWRDLQRIKNELTDPEREAVELFPAESRLIDTSNQFHLWVAPAGHVAPFGFNDGRVVLEPGELPEAMLEQWKELGGDPKDFSRARQRSRA